MPNKFIVGIVVRKRVTLVFAGTPAPATVPVVTITSEGGTARTESFRAGSMSWQVEVDRGSHVVQLPGDDKSFPGPVTLSTSDGSDVTLLIPRGESDVVAWAASSCVAGVAEFGGNSKDPWPPAATGAESLSLNWFAHVLREKEQGSTNDAGAREVAREADFGRGSAKKAAKPKTAKPKPVKPKPKPAKPKAKPKPAKPKPKAKPAKPKAAKRRSTR